MRHLTYTNPERETTAVGRGIRARVACKSKPWIGNTGVACQDLYRSPMPHASCLMCQTRLSSFLALLLHSELSLSAVGMSKIPGQFQILELLPRIIRRFSTSGLSLDGVKISGHGGFAMWAELGALTIRFACIIANKRQFSEVVLL